MENHRDDSPVRPLGHPKPVPRVRAPKRLARKAAMKARTKRTVGTRKHAHPSWRKLRAEALTRDRHWCQVCDAAPAVEVHHLAYGRGRGVKALLVPLDQVVSVCRRCHEAEHPWMREAA